MLVRFAPVSTLALLAFAGCDDDHDHDQDHDHTTALTLRFAAQVGDAPFSCTGMFSGVGAGAGVMVEPLDFRFYVHDVRLITADGEEVPVELDQDGLWQSGDLALLDFEDKTGTCANGTAPTNVVVKGTYDAEHADISGVSFKVGVPFAMNHGDAAVSPSPLNLSGLFWSWQGGYKFMRIDMKVHGSMVDGGGHGEAGGLNLHLGSTGCELDASTQSVASCSASNRPSITLDGFDVDNDTIVIDYGAIVADVDLSMDMGGAPGCMSGKDDPECEAIFEALGLSLESGSAQAGQTAFRLK